MKNRISIKDIAQRLGVSTALVSYVINGKDKEARVGKATAEKVRNLVRELNYQPNQIAKSLKSGKTQTIGAIVADIANPFFANMARIMEDEAKRNGYTIIFGSSDENAEKLKDLIDVFRKRQVDGLIIVPTNQSEDYIRQLHEQHFPFVLIDRYFPETDTNYIVTDNYDAALKATNHLIETGHQKIAMIGYASDLIHMQERKRGYAEALKSHHILVDDSLLKEVSHINIEQDVDDAIRELIDLDADSIFFANNSLATSGLKSINALGIQVPDDLAIVTFDESEAFDFFYSPLTYIKQPGHQMAIESIRVLLEQVAAKSEVPISSESICIPSELIIRKSSSLAEARGNY